LATKIGFLCLVGLILIGCTTAQASPPPATEADQSAEFVALAIADLATRLGMNPSQIEVESVTQQTWPDGSLGCPQPDMRYTQSPADGLLIELLAGGQTYAYHSGGTRLPFLCEPSYPQKPPTLGLDALVPTPSDD